MSCRFALPAALLALVVATFLIFRPETSLAQTPVGTATLQTGMCGPAQHSGGQTITVLNLQFTLPAGPGQYSSSFGRLSTGETIVRVCYLQGNSAIVFSQDGSERSRQVNDASAAAVLNSIAASVRVQAPPATTPGPGLIPTQPPAAPTSAPLAPTPPPSTSPPIVLPPNTGSGGLASE
jgi:hypothetical protein